MFFGQKLKEMRLKDPYVNARDFSKTMGIKPSELCNIEHGYSSPPSKDILEKILSKYAVTTEDWVGLVKSYKEPFIMQEMNEDAFITHATAADDHAVTGEELGHITTWFRERAKEHNKKAKEFNGKKKKNSTTS